MVSQEMVHPTMLNKKMEQKSDGALHLNSQHVKQQSLMTIFLIGFISNLSFVLIKSRIQLLMFIWRTETLSQIEILNHPYLGILVLKLIQKISIKCQMLIWLSIRFNIWIQALIKQKIVQIILMKSSKVTKNVINSLFITK